MRADARVVEVETGKVVKSTGASGKPQDFLGVEQQLSEAIGRILAQAPAMPTPPPATGTATATASAGKKPPKPPAKLGTKLALRYSKALDAKDRGDKSTAKQELAAVVKEQPDFRLAQVDIDKLIQ